MSQVVTKNSSPRGLAKSPVSSSITSRPPGQRTRADLLFSLITLLSFGSIISAASAAPSPDPANGDQPPALAAPLSPSATTVVIVVGAPGEAEFGSNFVRQAALWQAASTQANCRQITLGIDPVHTNDYDQLKQVLQEELPDSPGQLWLVLIGHGTYDGKEARFNLRGPDVAATELGSWLKPFHRPMAVIDAASCSAPFLNQLSASNRVIVTATRSGHEQNFTHFGLSLAEAINDSKADLDKDGQVSLLEAFLMASRRVAEFYKNEGRLATEHALLDDNGDGLGTPADWFRGLRAVKRAKENAAMDGLLARQFRLVNSDAEKLLTVEQRAHRDALEHAVLLLREKKSQLPEAEYYEELEKLLLELARSWQANPS